MPPKRNLKSSFPLQFKAREAEGACGGNSARRAQSARLGYVQTDTAQVWLVFPQNYFPSLQIRPASFSGALLTRLVIPEDDAIEIVRFAFAELEFGDTDRFIEFVAVVTVQVFD